MNRALQTELISVKKAISNAEIDKDIARVICEALSINEMALLSPSRKRELVDARIIIAKYMRDAGYTFGVIGLRLNRQYTSVIHYVREFNALVAIRDKRFLRKLADINECMYGIDRTD